MVWPTHNNTQNDVYLVNGKVVTPHRIVQPGLVHIHGETIARVVEMGQGSIPEGVRVVDVRGAWIIPGLIDIHVHGGGGGDTMDGSIDSLCLIASTHARGGTTAITPTTMTTSIQNITEALEAFAQARDSTIEGARLLGVHLEGPYFSYEQRGAQDPQYLKNPDPEEYLELLDRYPFITRVSAAPELPGALELGRELRRRRILASIAHTDATYDQVLLALDAGYSHMTHLYSGMSGMKRVNCYRVAGAIEAGLELDELTVEVIADGKHLPGSLLKLIYKCKGADRMALCSDALRPAGLPAGLYSTGQASDDRVLVEDGVAWLPDKSSFAGSVVTGTQLLKTMVEIAGVPFQEAVKMATITPARILNVDHVMGSLDPGKYADVVVMKEDFTVLYTIIGGKTVYAA